MKRLTIIFLLGCFCACSTNATDEGNIASDQVFPLAKGNYWIYETKYVKGEEIQEWKDTLKIGAKKIVDGAEGWGFDKSTTHAFRIGSMYPASKDTIYTIRQTRTGGNLFIRAFIFPSGADTVEFSFNYAADVGVVREIFIDHTNAEYENSVYKIQTAWQGGIEKEVITLAAGVGIVEQIQPGILYNKDGTTTKYTYFRTLIEHHIND